MDQLEPLYIIRLYKGAAILENSLAVPQNSYMVTIQPRNSTSKYKPRELNTDSHTETST